MENGNQKCKPDKEDTYTFLLLTVGGMNLTTVVNAFVNWPHGGFEKQGWISSPRTRGSFHWVFPQLPGDGL
jgi:hypothetical protein